MTRTVIYNGIYQPGLLNAWLNCNTAHSAVFSPEQLNRYVGCVCIT